MDPRRVVAEFQHANESLHRHHDLNEPSCSYCDLVGHYAVTALERAGFRIVPANPVAEEAVAK